MYADDDMLMLSGIQHYRFCPRQWALAYIELLWEDNRLTTEGQILHKRVDDSFYRQKCGDYICLRSVSIASHELGLYGLSDVIELRPTDDALNYITHPKYRGKWLPVPVEYKHGRPKRNQVDEVQLAAQVMCLEEQYHISLGLGVFYYAEIKHRVEVEITDTLRGIVRQCATEMHQLYNKATIPHADYRSCCNRCSLLNLCVPSRKGDTKASYYLKKNLYEKTT